MQQSAGTLDLYSCRSGPLPSRDVTDLLADSLGSATLDGLTAQGNVGCDQLLCNDVNCTDVFTTGVDASSAISCAVITATGTIAGATLTSTGAVSGSSLSITGAASVGLLSSATRITGSTLTINNTASAGNFTTVGDVSTGHQSTERRYADDHWGGLHGPAGLREPGLHLHGHERRRVDGQRGTVTNTSDFADDLTLTKNWAGWSEVQISKNSAASNSGPELRLLGNQSARVFLERDGGAHQRELIMINDEALVQTKSLSTQLSLTKNERNPGCLVIAGNTGNAVCNTSFTNLLDSRVKTENGGGRRGGAAAALRLRGGQAAQART